MQEEDKLAALAAELPAADIDKLVRVFVKMRDAKAELAAQTKAITEQQELIEAELLRRAIAENVTGFKTVHGTTYISEETSFSMADDRTFMDYVRETGSVDLLERRVSARNVKQFMEDHNGEVPPGLNWFKQSRMKIRRSNTSN